MRRSPPRPSLQFLAAAATATTTNATATATMSARPRCRGGRNQRPRGSSAASRHFCSGRDQYVTGDSHFRSVGDANLGFRQGDNAGAFHNQSGFRPPPPNFNQNQHLRRSPPFDPNQPYRPRPKPRDYRIWEYAKTTPPPPTCERFRVLSYNLLADSLANEHRSKLYHHVPPRMMNWEWRKQNFIFELGLWSADIMCFQEVDKFQELEEDLKQKGYSGIWKERTGNPVDGCAIFWRSRRFKMIHEECIEFSKLGLRDNVAQICVLESMCQNSTKDMAGPPTSSTSSNKVVICNIHVLYNPKRGDIKLGQVRVLLDRAHAVSKIWNDAPIVFCGDFNCTPKSPLYNFISEQKLDLSGVDRDKVSGQASAQIYAPRSCNPYHGDRPAYHFVQGPPVVGGRDAEMKPSDSPLEMKNIINPESTMENVPLANNCSQSHKLNLFDKSSTNVHCQKDDGSQDVEAKKETKPIYVSVVETESEFHVSGDRLKEDATTSYGKGGFPVDILSNENHECSHVEQAYSDVSELGYKEKEDFTSNSNPGSGHQDSDVGKEGMDFDINKRLSTMENDFVKEGIDPYYVDPLNSGNHPSKLSGQNSIADAQVSSTPCEVDISLASTTIDLDVQKHLESLSLTELDEAIPEDGNTAEDDNTFMSALHSTEDAFLSDFASAPPNSALSASTNVAEDGISPGLDSEVVNMKRTFYDPSLWTPMEMEAATGNSECTLLQHPLKLKSTYPEVEDCTGARDSNGEPQVTSYNRLFLGTVDYIWRSEGLQTVRVLAPIPKHAMQWTPGFPTKKWGSDHIALVSELAFITSSDQES